MEERYGDQQHFAAALKMFFSVNQEEGESVEVWAERLWKIAHKAYPGQSTAQYEPQVIARFSMGIFDKKTARYVCCQNPTSVRQAIEAYKMYEYASGVTDKPKSQIRRLGGQEGNNSQVPARPVVPSGPNPLDEINKKLSQMCRSQEKLQKNVTQVIEQSKGMEERLASLERRMDRSRGDRKVSFTRGGSSRENSASPNRSSCFKCGEQGHYAKDCSNQKKSPSGMRNIRRTLYSGPEASGDSDEEFSDAQE